MGSRHPLPDITLVVGVSVERLVHPPSTVLDVGRPQSSVDEFLDVVIITGARADRKLDGHEGRLEEGKGGGERGYRNGSE